jgi:hypothetical protein
LRRTLISPRKKQQGRWIEWCDGLIDVSVARAFLRHTTSSLFILVIFALGQTAALGILNLLVLKTPKWLPVFVDTLDDMSFLSVLSYLTLNLVMELWNRRVRIGVNKTVVGLSAILAL